MELAVTRRTLVAGVTALVGTSPGAAQITMAAHHQQSLTSAQKEREAFRFLALKVFVEIDSAESRNAVAVLRVFVPSGEGAAPHVHSREDEVHSVIRGHYRFRHGDQEIDAPAGTTVFMPKGIPHTFRNVGDTTGEHTVTFVPGGLERMFREVSAARLVMPRDRAKYAAIAATYGM